MEDNLLRADAVAAAIAKITTLERRKTRGLRRKSASPRP